jgi:hypothetical protein
MLAILVAAAVLGVPPPDAPASLLGEAPPAMRARACGLWDAKPVRRTAPPPKFRKLGDLPKANLEIAVLRLDPNGCSVPLIVRHEVEGDGRTAP